MFFVDGYISGREIVIIGAAMSLTVAWLLLPGGEPPADGGSELLRS